MSVPFLVSKKGRTLALAIKYFQIYSRLDLRLALKHPLSLSGDIGWEEKVF